MTGKNVRLIFLREVRDQLRDRRTLFMVAVLPLMLYPALGIGMAQMLNTFSEQTRTVVVLGAEHLPAPQLLDAEQNNSQFSARWFSGEESAEKLRVVTEAMVRPQAPDDSALDPEMAAFVHEAIARQASIERLGRLVRERERAEVPVTEPSAEEQKLRQELDAWFKSGPAQVLIAIPRNFQQKLEEINERMVNREPVDEALAALQRPVVLHNSADEKSLIAARRVRDVVHNWESAVLAERLRNAGLPASLPEIVDATTVDMAASEEISATLWSKLFPTLLVMMAITGAFYPAIDLGAGEKERGTMETLLICPATRTEIVLGKFLTVMLFSLSTALLNLISMGATSHYLLSMAGSGSRFSQFSGASFPPASALVWVILLAIPLSALFSALSLALAMFAKSSKEGQYYLTPLLMVTMGLTMFCLSPSVEINPYYSVYPVVGPGLLLKSLLLSQSQPYLWGYAVAVLGSSFAYSALALWWAIEQFKSEDVLFREAERFELGLWLRHILRDREPTPSFTEAGFCFVLILMLQFASFGVLSDAFRSAHGPGEVLKLQTIYLLVTVGTPALLMAAMLTTSLRQTLKLRWPGWTMMLVATVLPFVLQPLSMELLTRLDWFFPDPPAGVQEIMAAMAHRDVVWWLPLLAFAVTPAICEELAFRGFILSGLQRARSPWVPIVLSAMAFGIVHMIPQQVFNAMLLGIVIGMLAVRSGSIWPCIWFHFLFNGMQVLMQRADLPAIASATDGWLFRLEMTDGKISGLRFEWPLLLPCLVASIVLITWLARSLRRSVPPEDGGHPQRYRPSSLTAHS